MSVLTPATALGILLSAIASPRTLLLHYLIVTAKPRAQSGDWHTWVPVPRSTLHLGDLSGFSVLICKIGMVTHTMHDLGGK